MVELEVSSFRKTRTCHKHPICFKAYSDIQTAALGIHGVVVGVVSGAGRSLLVGRVKCSLGAHAEHWLC